MSYLLIAVAACAVFVILFRSAPNVKSKVAGSVMICLGAAFLILLNLGFSGIGFGEWVLQLARKVGIK